MTHSQPPHQPAGPGGAPGPGPWGPAGGGPAYAGYPPPPPRPWVPGGTGVEDVVRYAWTRFQQQPGPLVLGVLAWLGVILALSTVLTLAWVGAVVGGALAEDAGVSSAGPTLAAFGIGGVVYLLMLLVGVLVQAATARAALDVTAGRRVTVGTFFRADRFGTVVLTGLLVLALQVVGMLLCFLPALVAAFYTQFTFLFMLDKGLGPVEALRSSARLVQRNLGPTALVMLVAVLANQVGSAVVVGALVTIPVTAVAQAYLYRRLLGEPVA